MDIKFSSDEFFGEADSGGTLEDWAIEKVCNKDLDSDPVEPIIEKGALEPTMSWKNKLISYSKEPERAIAPIRLDSESDFEIHKGDVNRSEINGVLYIDFSERIKNLLVKDIALTVIVKLLSRNIWFMTLQNRISNLWRPSMPVHLMDIENGYYLVKFQDKNDYEKVLSQGP